MTADITFPNVEVYGTPSGQRVRVRLGETFGINLNDVGDEPIVWATVNDAVLKLADAINVAEVVAEAVGASEVQIQRNRTVVHYITVEVYGTEATGFRVPNEPVNEPL